MSSSATASQTDSQHRLARIQVYNWGTFSGYHDLPVPRDGLLLTGPSGSGKSSLLDALSAVLVPPRNLRFNAAAQDSTTGDHSRSVLSYVRGAYRRSADEITGEVVTDYLRSGATRSGVALTFTRLDPGETITLVKLFHARQGSTSANSVSQTQLLVEGDIALTGLMEYLTNGIDRQALSRDLEGRAARFERYEAFAARFRRRLGLSGEVAQRLLHRTQSAKNLTSLDTLLRDFMLDEPDTFAMAAAAVEQSAGWGRQMAVTSRGLRGYLVVKTGTAVGTAALPVVVVLTAGALTDSQMEGWVWVVSPLICLIGVLPFVLWGLAAGMWLPSSASIGIATSLVSLFAFIGNAFMPLSHTLLTISRFTPMYGATALARWPLGEGWAYVPDRQAGIQDPLWMPLANLVVWTLIFGLLVIGARRRATRRR